MRQDRFLSTHRLFIVALAVAFFAFLAWAFFAKIDTCTPAAEHATGGPDAWCRLRVDGGRKS